MWVWQILRHHKMAVEGGCFSFSGCFPTPDAMWQRPFHAHPNIDAC